MSNQDWYARKFGNPPQPQQPQQPIYPPQYYQQPGYPPQVPSPYPPAQFQPQQPMYPQQQVPMYPQQQQPMYPYPQQMPQQPGYPPNMYPAVPQAMPGYKIQEAQGFVSKPPSSARSTSTCPDCGSGNYMMRGKIAAQNGTVEHWQCLECGYPVRHTTSGMSGTGKAAPSKQVATGGFNPQGIVGRIDSI